MIDAAVAGQDRRAGAPCSFTSLPLYEVRRHLRWSRAAAGLGISVNGDLGEPCGGFRVATACCPSSRLHGVFDGAAVGVNPAVAAPRNRVILMRAGRLCLDRRGVGTPPEAHRCPKRPGDRNPRWKRGTRPRCTLPKRAAAGFVVDPLNGGPDWMNRGVRS
jgi:hypothetical protein